MMSCVCVDQIDGPQPHWFHTLQVKRTRGRRGRSNSDPLGENSCHNLFTRVCIRPWSTSGPVCGLMIKRIWVFMKSCHDSLTYDLIWTRVVWSESGSSVRSCSFLCESGETGWRSVLLRLQRSQQVRRRSHLHVTPGLKPTVSQSPNCASQYQSNPVIDRVLCFHQFVSPPGLKTNFCFVSCWGSTGSWWRWRWFAWRPRRASRSPPSEKVSGWLYEESQGFRFLLFYRPPPSKIYCPYVCSKCPTWTCCGNGAVLRWYFKVESVCSIPECQVSLCLQHLCSNVWNMPTLSSSTISSTPKNLWPSSSSTWWVLRHPSLAGFLLIWLLAVLRSGAPGSVVHSHSPTRVAAANRPGPVHESASWRTALTQCSGSSNVMCSVFSRVRLDFGLKRLLVLLDLHVPAAESSQLHSQPEDPPQRPKTSEPAHQLPGRTQDGRLWWASPAHNHSSV